VKTLRALVIAPEPFFTPRGTPLSVYHRTAAAARLGVQIDLLTYGQGADVDLPGVRIVRVPSLGLRGEVPAGPSLQKLLLDPLLALWAIALLARHRYDIVHAHEEAVFFALFLKPIFRFRLVYDMHSRLPDQLVHFRFTRSRIWIALFRRLEDAALRHADAVITICPDLASFVEQRGVARHVLIENSLCDPVRLARPQADAEAGGLERVRAALASWSPAPPLVVYAGTLEAYQGIELLLRSFVWLRAEIPEARLLVIGGTPEQVERYRALAAALGLGESCRFTGRVSQQAARAGVAAATLQVSPRIAGTNTPLKVYEQLASGVALVATDVHAHRQVLDSDVAFLAAPEESAFAVVLSAALRDAGERKRRAEAARRLHAQRYSQAQYEQKLEALLSSLA
jgi:glycosyltransferase involved in cell wall biosynthesis